MATVKQTSVLKTPTAKATTTLENQSPVLPLPDTPQGMLAVGPRVTFRFVQDYDQANSYDYYDVVNVDGTSYIAIQDVPANTPIADADYWVKWNDPNAQLALLQATVEQYDARITANTNGLAQEVQTREEQFSTIATKGLYSGKNVMFVTDSWGVNNANNNGVTDAYPYQVCRMLGATLIRSMVSGSGFVNTSGGQTYLQRLQNYPYKENIAAIFIQASINDAITSYTSLTSAMNDTIKYAVDNYPNADVYIIPCIRSQTPNVFESSVNTKINNPWYGINLALSQSNHPGGVLWGVEKCLQASSLDCMAADTIHENQNGADVIAMAVYATIFGSTNEMLTTLSNFKVNGNVVSGSYYGNRDGKSVLIIPFNNIEASAQYNITFDGPAVIDPGYLLTTNNDQLIPITGVNVSSGVITPVKFYGFLHTTIGEFAIRLYTENEKINGTCYLYIG